MSAYKELSREVSRIYVAQHPISSRYKPCPAIGFKIGAIGDQPFIEKLRAVVSEYRSYGSIAESSFFRLGIGEWKFTFEAIEGVEDGYKRGFVMVVTMLKDGHDQYLSLTVRDPN